MALTGIDQSAGRLKEEGLSLRGTSQALGSVGVDISAGFEMKITYDPSADAMYVSVVTSPSAGSTIVDEMGTIVDLDESGVPRGFEFLSVHSGVALASLPADVAEAVRDFISSGALESDAFVERTVELTS